MTTSSTRGSPAPRTILGGRYQLLFELASGGMGTVYVGRRLGPSGFQRLVAIKRMHASIAQDPEALAAFQDEARIASLVQHANVVAIHDVEQGGDEPMLVMDYIDGASLAVLLGSLRRSGKRLSRRVGLRILIEALRGLHAAHELTGLDGSPLELVHRDATPHNILLGVDGSVRLTDFGIARAASRTVHTDPGFAKGKYAYMPPEQAFADPLDRRADVFAMGVVAWETLTGRRLFENRTMHEIARGMATGQIPSPSETGAGTPPELDRVVMRALAPWRDDRYATAALFADALDAFARSDGGLVPSSAVADVLELACGAQIRARRERIREVLADGAAAAEESGAAVPAERAGPDEVTAEAGGARGAPAASPRIATPSSLSRDLPGDRRPAPVAPISRRAIGIAAASSAFALVVGLAIGSFATARPAAPPVALRIAPHALRAVAEAKIDAIQARPGGSAIHQRPASPSSRALGARPSSAAPRRAPP